MKKRYYEIQINSPEVPPNRRVVHVVTLKEGESPLKRAVAEGLLPKDEVPKASIREVSFQECLRRWQETKWNRG